MSIQKDAVSMKEFVQTRKFKAIAHVVVFALLLPFYSLLLARQAQAQVQSAEQWAVVPFSVRKPVEGVDLSNASAAALTTELTKVLVRTAEIIPADTVVRDAENLGFPLPIKRDDQLARLGQSLGAATIVTGEIVNQRIRDLGGNQVQAEVKVRVIVKDVASNMPINGAALVGASSVRPKDTDASTLYQDALASAASSAAGEISRNTLPKGTVLNTTETLALINMGTRSGFKVGQKVVVLRGRQQVATAEVTQVEADSCFVRVSKSLRGIQPGDKVQVMFEVPDISEKFSSGGDVGVIKSRPKSNNSGLITTILVLGVLVAVVGSKGGKTSVQGITTAAVVEPDDRIGVQINWRPDAFSKGRSQRVLWQIWRSDVPDVPVIVVSDAALGGVPSVRDYGTSPALAYFETPTSGDPTCPQQQGGSNNGGLSRSVPIQSGVPYTYSIELMYRIAGLDNPLSTAGSSGGTTGTTAGGTTGTTTGGGTTGGTTGGGLGGGLGGRGYESPRDLYGYYQATTGATTGTTTGSTTGGSSSECYILGDRSTAKGTATPFRRPVANAPINNVTLTQPQVFRFQVERPAGGSTVMNYVIQFSTDPGFGTIRSTAEFTDNTSTSIVATPNAISDVLTVFPGVAEIWWRVGIRNGGDKSSPVGGYILSQVQRFKRPTNPPNP
jgi:hypothetical protein